MSWNRPDIKQVEGKRNFNWKDNTAEQLLPRSNILEACKKHGYLTSQVAIIMNHLRNQDHEYLIGLKVDPTRIKSMTFGL